MRVGGRPDFVAERAEVHADCGQARSGHPLSGLRIGGFVPCCVPTETRPRPGAPKRAAPMPMDSRL